MHTPLIDSVYRTCSIQTQSSIGTHSSFHDVLTRNAPRSFLRLRSYVRRLNHHQVAVFPANVLSQGSRNTLIDLDFDLHSIESLQYNEAGKFPFDTNDAASCKADETKEMERRKKIGMANKGNVPWNKGRPHTPETRARIKQRTIEAMRDPKVRRKMSESQRRHSDQVKTKISFSLTKLWGERLKCKRAKEKLYMSWLENIAEVARKGGVNEEELSWDSYDKLKREIDLRNLERATEKAKAKERKRTRVERKVRTKAKRATGTRKRPRKKHQNPQEVELEEDSNLKTRLTKIQRKKNMNGQTCSHIPAMVSSYPSLELLDLQFIEREKIRMKISLADEIQAAKNRRNGSVGCGSLTTSYGFEE